MTTQTQDSDVLLTMTDVSKSFPGVKALDHANLTVRSHSVHALMGENGAGKSTLLKCLFGIYAKDEGAILFLGKPVDFKTSKEALENGISMVHQELNLVRQTSVMDNLWLGRYPLKGPFVDHAKMYRDTKAIFDELDIDVDPKEKVAKLSVSQMQMIEIAKAFSYNAKIVIMDEPTSSLSEKEVEHLFKIIQKLKDRGCGIIYISHKMDEIFKICDEITILRDGKWINTVQVKGTTMEEIVSMMVGRELTQRFPERTNVPKEITLEVEHLTAVNQPSIQDVSFNLRKGEILGIAGLVGAKRTDIVEAIFGVRELKEGTIKLNGKIVKNHTALEAINHGFALVTEERRSTGIYSNLSIEFNSLISNMKSYLTPWKLLSNKKMASDTQWVIDAMNVKTPSHKTTIGSLSGGNQQKVIIGRWLLTQPDILMLDEPTNHLDLDMRQALTEALVDYEGSLVVVSHDRHLLRNTVEEFYLVHDKKVEEFKGDLEDYQKWLNEQNSAPENKSSEKNDDNENSMQNRKEQKRREAELRQQTAPLRKQITQLEEKMNKHASKLAEIENQLADSELYSAENKEKLTALLAQQVEVKKALEEVEMDWLAAQEELEAMLQA